MKKIYILINRFQLQDGVARTAIGLANELADQDDVEVTIQSIFKFDPKMKSMLSPAVRVKSFFGFFFRGFPKLVDLIPDRLLYRIIVRERYDVEIGFCMKLPIKIIGASNNRQCVRYMWMHGYDEGLKLKSSYKKADKIICVSKVSAERFARETNGTIPVTYAYNLVDDEKVRQMGQAPICCTRSKDITFVAVGRLEPGKGMLRLVECVGRLKNDGYELKLWLIGDGTQRSEIERRVSELKLEDTVSFFGTQENPHSFTAKADVLVCPSFSEGYSTVCTEAVMLGVPVLTTDVAGGREIIDDAHAGMLVGMKDEDIFNGMKQILDHPEWISSWKKTLLTTRTEFSHKKRASRLLEVLKI